MWRHDFKDKTELYLLEKHEKKNLLGAVFFLHIRGKTKSDRKLEHILFFCVLQLLYSLYWCSFNLSASPRSGSLPLDLHKTDREAT